MSKEIEEFDPTRLLRAGRFDAITILGVQLGRQASYAMLWLALFVLTVTGEAIEDLTQLNTISELLGAIFSPFIWVVVAILVRFAVGWIGVFAAYPLTQRRSTIEITYRTPFREWQDRYFQTKAFTDLRRSWAVRQIAAERLGETGVLLTRAWLVLRWATYLSFAAFAIAALVRFS